MSDPYDDYSSSQRDSYRLVRVKRAWLPDWAWRIAATLDRHGKWLTRWLSTPASSREGR